jgi:hypothetical protein
MNYRSNVIRLASPFATMASAVSGSNPPAAIIFPLKNPPQILILDVVHRLTWVSDCSNELDPMTIRLGCLIRDAFY